MTRKRLMPDYLFEVSWEVCNKVGGIHTVRSLMKRKSGESGWRLPGSRAYGYG